MEPMPLNQIPKEVAPFPPSPNCKSYAASLEVVVFELHLEVGWNFMMWGWRIAQ
jgi:hypothetical protein